jgi:cell wall-associated NlpC family hydrolase
MTDYSELIGTPFEYGGRGPDKYDCWGLVMHLYRSEKGIGIPDYISPSDASRIAALMIGDLHLWEQIEEAKGAVVLFRASEFMHVGYCIGNGRFIHTWDKSGGVCIERLSDWKRRILGFYKYVGK